MTETEMHLDQIEDYARTHLDIAESDVMSLLGISKRQARELLETLDGTRLQRKGSLFVIAPRTVEEMLETA